MKNKTKSEPQDALALIADITSMSLTYLQAEIKGITTGKIKPKGHDPASRVAWLQAKVSGIGAEERKSQAARDRRLDQLKYEDVMAWIRRLKPEMRAQVVRDASAIDEERSVLA